MSLHEFAPRYELTKMISYVELDRPFEEASEWLHENLCTRWWHRENVSVMKSCYEIVPELKLDEAHKQFALAHFARLQKVMENDD